MRSAQMIRCYFALIFSLVLFEKSFAQSVFIIEPSPGDTLSSTETFFFPENVDIKGIRIGSNGEGSNDIFELISADGQNLEKSVTVSGIPTDKIVYINIYFEFEEGKVYVDSYTYNSDLDEDTILDYIDPEPGVFNSDKVFTGSDYTLILNGSGRAINLVSPSLFSSVKEGKDLKNVTNNIYSHFSDSYDFIIIGHNIKFRPQSVVTAAGTFSNTKNTSSIFGSSGKLAGVIWLNGSNLNNAPTLHEIAHNWANYLSSVPTISGSHWGASNVGGILGGWSAGTLETIGNGIYRAGLLRGTSSFNRWNLGGNGGIPYSNFELYIMGLLPKEEVGHDILIANDFSWIDISERTFQASGFTTVAMDQVSAIDGPNLPDSESSQREFRALYVIVSDSRLSPGEMRFIDEEAAIFEYPGNDEVSSFNFWEATGGRATIRIGNGQVTELNVGPTLDTTLKDVEILFNFGQQAEPNLFSPPATTQQITVAGSQWVFRYFAGTQTYVAVNLTDGDNFIAGGVYVLGGPFGEEILFIDSLANLLLQLELR